MKNIGTLPRWIPNHTKSEIGKKFSDIVNEQYKRELYEKWEFVHAVFTKESLKPTWKKLSDYPEEDINTFASEIFNLPHNWDDQLALENRRLEYEKKLNKSIHKLITAKKELDKASLYKNAEVEEAWNIIEANLQKRLFEMDKKDDCNYADYYFSSFISPLTRKKNVENAHPIYCMRWLSLVARVVFNQPLNDVVADFVNAIFETIFSQDDVASYTKDIKISYDKIKEAKIPFASTVDLKTEKILLVDSEE